MEFQFVPGRGCYPAIHNHSQTQSLKTSCTGAGTNWVSVSVVTFAFISHQNYRIMNHVCGMKVILLLWSKSLFLKFILRYIPRYKAMYFQSQKQFSQVSNDNEKGALNYHLARTPMNCIFVTLMTFDKKPYFNAV